MSGHTIQWKFLLQASLLAATLVLIAPTNASAETALEIGIGIQNTTTTP